MSLEEVAAELYGLAPEDFTAARNARSARAKSAGDAELAASVRTLRKPTVGAWLVNQLVRRHPDDVERLFELGARLRAAQGTIGAAELRTLGSERRRLTGAVAEQAARIGMDAGRRVSRQVVDEVEETLRSAMVDPAAGAALATGRLVETFSSTGLEPVDLFRCVAMGVVPALPATGAGHGAGASPRLSRTHRAADEKAIAEARRAVEVAEAAAETARRECAQARDQAVEAGRRLEDLLSDLEVARRQVQELERRTAGATEAERTARRAQIAATRAERSAVEALETARGRLRSVLPDGSP